MSDSDVPACQSVMRCTLIDVTTEDGARCVGRSLEIVKRRGAAGLKYVKCDPMSVRKLELVCRADGHEIKSTEQLQQHLAWGHGQMFLMGEETELNEFDIALNLDKMSRYLTELTTGDVEKNLLMWASTRPDHLRALCSVGPSEELKKANQSSFSLMDIQIKAAKVVFAEEFKGSDLDIYEEDCLKAEWDWENASDHESDWEDESAESSGGSACT